MAATTPSRESILAAFVTELEKIKTTSDAYRTNVQKVYRRMMIPEEVEDALLPYCVVIGESEARGADGGYHGIGVVRDFTVVVWGFTKWNEVDDEDGPTTDQEKLIEDVRETITDDPQMGIPTIIVDTKQNGIDTDHGLAKPYSWFWMEFVVSYYREETGR